ncbi:hypothetical protein AAG570_003454 [Ranatra chinensis]|uniref:Uncharacterized protein n=1 Tax=Ranatra chinensis TaxID=642074 RepID=A0ABD0YQG4_9HEMI
MTSLTKGLLHILFLGTVALAIPLSLIEDVKELRLKAPARSNKAASDVDDNTLSDVATLPNILPQLDENNYESNQLDVGSRVADLDRAYQYGGGEPVYNMQLRNVAFKDQLYNDPMFSELGMYNTVDARRKRETKHLPSSYKLGFRSKRELDFNPDDILPLIKLWEAEQRNKLRDSKYNTRIGWPTYNIDSDDYDGGESQEDNEIEPDSEYMQNGEVQV